MEYRNCKFNQYGTIDCEINHPAYGWIPFTAEPNDIEEHGRILHQQILNDGSPIAPYVPPSDEEIAIIVRVQRNDLLLASDWTQLPDVPQNIKDLWAPYRQALRDITLQSGFPKDVIWPTSPT